MGVRLRTFAAPLGQACRTVAVGLIAGVLRGRSQGEIAAALDRRRPGERAAIIGSAIGLLFLFSLVAAQFGWIGLLLYWLAVIVLVN